MPGLVKILGIKKTKPCGPKARPFSIYLTQDWNIPEHPQIADPSPGKSSAGTVEHQELSELSVLPQRIPGSPREGLQGNGLLLNLCTIMK